MRRLRHPALRVALTAVGGAVLALILSLLPADVRAATRAFLLLAASAVLLMVAAALFALPARRLLATTFALRMRLEGPRFGLVREDEMRTTLSPLVVAGTCLGVALLAEVMAG